MTTFDIFKRFKNGILIAVSLVAIEKIAWIIEPSLFGNVIDSMIATVDLPDKGIVVIPLSIWIGVFGVNSIVGAIRRSVDEKIYINMFAEIASDIVAIGRDQGQPVSKTAMRAELSREFITFFQYRVPETIEQGVDIGGAIIALAFFDWRISATCLFIVLPLFYLTRVYGRRVLALQKEFHDSREEVFETFEALDPVEVRNYYRRTGKIQQKIANWGAMNFGIFRAFLLAIFLVVLYISIDLDDFSTGNIYAIVAYLWTFVTSAEYLPELLESWTSLQDISRRLRTQAE